MATSKSPQRKAAKQRKVKKVMHEFKVGDLKSSSGATVRKRKQAVAIAMSEAGISRKDNGRAKSSRSTST